MIFIVYSETTEHSLEDRLGKPDYSYHFVLKTFRPVLERLGTVVELSPSDGWWTSRQGLQVPLEERLSTIIDAVFDVASSHGEDCLFLSFTPPHRTLVRLRCPTVCVFAWEFHDLPGVAHEDAREDWRYVFGTLGRAITHSEHAAAVTRKAMGEDFPISVIPAPVWDAFAPRQGDPDPSPILDPIELEFDGNVIEAHRMRSEQVEEGSTLQARAAISIDLDEPTQIRSGGRRQPCRMRLDGVVYTAVLNPDDGRKNWEEMVRCFGLALRGRPDATLVIKLIQNGGRDYVRFRLWRELDVLGPLLCRIVMLDGLLDAETYRRLMASTTFVVNSSFGEGQCLPLMESMSAGRPAIAPKHTGMADYVDSANSFLVESSLEPAQFPHQPGELTTWRNRIDAHSLYRAFRESYRVATEDPERYAEMSRQSTERLRLHCSAETCETALRGVLAQPPVTRPVRAEFGPRHRVLVEPEDQGPIDESVAESPTAGIEAEDPIVMGPVPGVDLHFIVAGFAKCGTTTLSALLGMHPQLFIPTTESWFFGSNNLLDDVGYAAFFARAEPGQRLGECSVVYSSITDEVESREQILARYPGVRMLFVAREPLDRLESSYREVHHSWHRFGMAPPPFDVGETLRKIPQMVPDSQFSARLACYADYLPAGHVHVLFFEDLMRDPAAVLRSCFEFLGVDPDVPIPARLPWLNPGSGKHVDTKKLRSMLETPDELGATKPLEEIPLDVLDQIGPSLGLRRAFDGPLPGWGEDVQRWFAEQIAEDAQAFLAKHGKDLSFWPRLASLLSR